MKKITPQEDFGANVRNGLNEAMMVSGGLTYLRRFAFTLVGSQKIQQLHRVRTCDSIAAGIGSLGITLIDIYTAQLDIYTHNTAGRKQNNNKNITQNNINGTNAGTKSAANVSTQPVKRL